MRQFFLQLSKLLRSGWALAAAVVVLGLAVVGGGWYLSARSGAKAGLTSPLPVPASASPTAGTATPATSTQPVAISHGRAPSAPLKVPDGYAIHIFADRLGAARDLELTPGGTLLVSDPDASTVTALPDRNRDGVADSAKIIIRDRDNLHGLAFHDGRLFVAETSRVVRYDWNEAALTASNPQTLFALPGANDDHNKRTLVFDKAGNLYVSVGSTCDVCRESDPRSATIMVSGPDGSNPRVFASGLRNAPFMAINPASGELWATEMGRDYLGDDLPPDEINIVRQGHNYGWPLCYGNGVHDTNFDHNTYIADPCATTSPPIYQIQAHSAPLGLAFINSSQFPKDQQSDLLVAYHGSWNRSVPDGYKVVRLTVRSNSITGASDFITGFITGRTATARPVDLIFDSAGNLFLSDDKSGTVYIVQKLG